MDSEKEFLSSYRLEDYYRPSVTADVITFMIRRDSRESYRREPHNVLSLLLIKRGGHPYKGCYALPGGFLQPDETVEECALREITEETNVTPSALMPLGVYSQVGRDPRGWVISNAFVSIISEESVNAVGGDDASEAGWFDVSFEEDQGKHLLKLTCGKNEIRAVLKEKSTRFGFTDFEIIDSGSLAFDHAAMIASALTILRRCAKDFELIFDFLPEKFTLGALQRVQETIMNISVLPANFRRKAGEYVTETDEFTSGDGHRPARLYKRKQEGKT